MDARLLEIVISLCTFIFATTCGIFLYLMGKLEKRLEDTARNFGAQFENISKAVEGIGENMVLVLERSRAHEKRLDRVEGPRHGHS